MVAVGRADQGEIALIGDREENPAIGELEEIGVRVVEQLADHDVRTAHQPHAIFRRLAQQAIDLEHRRPGGVDEGAGRELAGRRLQLPPAFDPARSGQRRARADFGAMCHGIKRIEHHQPGIIDPAVRILERRTELGLQRCASGVAVEVDRAGRRQVLAPADMVIEEQAKPQQPAWAQALHMRQDEAERVDDVRGDRPQRLALGQALADQGEFVMLEIA